MIEQPNPYKETARDPMEREENQVVQVKVFDILFEDQVCNLVYMRDMPNLERELPSEIA